MVLSSDLRQHSRKCFLDRPCLQHAATSMLNKIMLQHTASYRNMLAALKHAATLVTLMIRQRTLICVANRGVVTKEASQGIKRNWSCVCIARLRYAANLQACSLYERGPHDIVTQPCCPILQSQALPKTTSLTSLSSRPFPPTYLQLLQGVLEKDICFCLASRCAFMRTPASEEA